jgi:hypothetical protein
MLLFPQLKPDGKYRPNNLLGLWLHQDIRRHLRHPGDLPFSAPMQIPNRQYLQENPSS